MQHIYYIIAAAIIVLFSITLLVLRKKLKPARSPQDLYIQSLNELILGEPERALHLLRKLVRSNTDYIDAYIHISNILRSKGDNENAIRILRDLLTRTQLTQAQEKIIIRFLALNYWECDQYNWTLYACDRLLALDKTNKWAKKKKIHCFEQLEEWENAFVSLKKFPAETRETKQSVLALYKVKQGLSMLADKSEHQARLCFREAIKIKTDCFPAHLELLKSYIREQQTKDAMKELKRLVQKIPEMAPIALEELSPALSGLGQYNEVESLYLWLLNSDHHSVDVYLGLANIKEKKGEIAKAIELNRKAYKQSKSDKLLLQIIRLESILEQYQLIKKDLLDVPQAHSDRIFVCEKCGHSIKEFFWHCPQCKSWNSAQWVNK